MPEHGWEVLSPHALFLSYLYTLDKCSTWAWVCCCTNNIFIGWTISVWPADHGSTNLDTIDADKYFLFVIKLGKSLDKGQINKFIICVDLMINPKSHAYVWVYTH